MTFHFKKEIIKSIIFDALGKNETISIEECKIKRIKNKELIKSFLDKNHIDGYKTSKICVGLFYDDELISILCVNDNEIIRHCDKLYVNIDSLKTLVSFLGKKLVIKLNRSYYFGEGIKTEPNVYYIIDKMRQRKEEKDSIRIYDSGYLLREIGPY